MCCDRNVIVIPRMKRGDDKKKVVRNLVVQEKEKKKRKKVRLGYGRHKIFSSDSYQRNVDSISTWSKRQEVTVSRSRKRRYSRKGIWKLTVGLEFEITWLSSSTGQQDVHSDSHLHTPCSHNSLSLP